MRIKGFYESERVFRKKSINLLKFIYQEKFNIEIAVELFKLSEILCNCGNYKNAWSVLMKKLKLMRKF